MYWKTADEIAECCPDTAIIPVGSIEQHGAHLPVMTDWAIANGLGRRVAELMNAFAVPALPVSTNREQMGKLGTVWMEPLTFYQMMTDMILCLKLQGFKRIGILQCHGGIFIMTPLVRDLNARYNPDLMVAIADSCTFGAVLYREGILETSTELHAGEGETSQMLAIAPETVHMEQAVDFVPDVPRSYLNYGSIFRATPSGVWGEATKGSAQKGEMILERSARLAAEEFEKAFAYMSGKERINYSDF
ncbi:MAG: creatininase family protein [Lachnospiraceae bacterium]|nr:creatininase family protein [Lachnospiraceae bacterium]